MNSFSIYKICTAIVLACTTFATSGCDYSFLTGDPIKYISSIYSHEVVILEYNVKSVSTKLHYFRKASGHYTKVQTLHLNSYLQRNGPSMVTFNDKWLAIGNSPNHITYHPYLNRPYGGRVYIFYKRDGLWNYHSTIENPDVNIVCKEPSSNFGQTIALSDTNILLCSYVNNNIEVFYSYKLTGNKPVLKQILTPQFARESHDNRASYGLNICLSHKTLLVSDSTQVYHNDDTIEVKEYMDKCHNKRWPPPIKQDICVYQLQSDLWIFKGSLVESYRKLAKMKETNPVLVDFDINFYPYIGIFDKNIYARGKIVGTNDWIDLIYNIDNKDNIICMSYTNDSTIKKNNINMSRCIPGKYICDIDSGYHKLRRNGALNADIYPHADIQRNIFYAEPLCNIKIITEELLKYQEETDVFVDISLSDNILVVSFTFPEAFSWVNKQNRSCVYGRIKIYEINDGKAIEQYKREIP